MKKFRYLVVLALTLALIGSLVSLAQAESQKAAGNKLFAEDSFGTGDDGGFVILSQQYLMCGYSRISYNGAGKVYVYGYTEAYEDVQGIDLELRLQKYDNGMWTTIKMWGFYGSDRDYIEGSGSCYIDKGYFYRVRGNHDVYHYGVHESGTTYTGGIYCD